MRDFVRLRSRNNLRRDRQELFNGYPLLGDRFEFIIDDIDAVKLTRKESLNSLAHNFLGGGKLQMGEYADMPVSNLICPLAEKIVRFLANDYKLHIAARLEIGIFRFNVLDSGLDDVRVKCSAQAAIRSHHDNGSFADCPFSE